MLRLPAEGSLVWLLICWLAVWRLTALLTYDRGPFDVLVRARAGLAKVGLHRVFTCFHCTALWVSLGLVVIMFEWSRLSLLMVLGVAGAASVTERFLGGTASETPDQRADG